ncbi:MAG: YihY family inner membrane protein [Pseudomonadota bacterium]|nr:YihY family inner membrane protein [Pseudomonadota bacterium]
MSIARTLEKLHPVTVVTFLRRVGGLSWYTMRRFYMDNGFQTVSALTYTSLLALVPLMTIAFAILAAFPAFDDVQQQARSLIFSNLVPAVGDAILTYLDRFTRNAGRLTGFGIAGIAITSVMLLATIETAFNSIWRAREPRPLVTRLLAFWSILTLGPLLFGISLSVSGTLTSLMQALNLRTGTQDFLQILAFIALALEAVGFTVLYVVIPNRTVQWTDALAGGIVATILFELSKRGFGWYLAAFPAYQTIYGALALIPIFLLWLYVAWSTVLCGAVVAASLPEWRSGQLTQAGPEGLAPSQRLVVAVAILRQLHEANHLGVGLRRHTLLGRIPVGGSVLDDLLDQLSAKHWIVRSSRDAWVLSRDVGQETLYDLVKALDTGFRGMIRGIATLESPWQDSLLKLVGKTDQSVADVLSMPVRKILEQTDTP